MVFNIAVFALTRGRLVWKTRYGTIVRISIYIPEKKILHLPKQVMFFYFSKILHFFVSPLSWIMILLVLALWWRNRPRGKKLLVAAVCVFFVFSNSFIVGELARLSEVPMVGDNELKKYDAAIVLGGGMITIDRPADRLIFQQNTDRVLQAVMLYKRGVVKKLLISGGSGSMVYKDMLEAPLLKRYLVLTGIPSENILVDSLSRNTYENAVNSAKILRDSLPGGSFLLITSALHMKRAQGCFTKQGVATEMFPANKITGQHRRWDAAYLIVPNFENFTLWEKLLHEWIGYLVYLLAGYA